MVLVAQHSLHDGIWHDPACANGPQVLRLFSSVFFQAFDIASLNLLQVSSKGTRLGAGTESVCLSVESPGRIPEHTPPCCGVLYVRPQQSVRQRREARPSSKATTQCSTLW